MWNLKNYVHILNILFWKKHLQPFDKLKTFDYENVQKYREVKNWYNEYSYTYLLDLIVLNVFLTISK